MDATGAIRAGRPLSASTGTGWTIGSRGAGAAPLVPVPHAPSGAEGVAPLALGLRLQLGFEVVVGVEAPAVVPIVLHEAEVDRHLAHRAGHSLSPPLCGGSPYWPNVAASPSARDPRATPPFCGMTIFSAVVRLASRRYPSFGRTPSTAVPTRTCVAPAATASSRSALIPADTMFAAGRVARRAVDKSINRSKAARRRPAYGPASGATVISPPSRSPGAASTAAANSSIPSGATPPRSPRSPASASSATWRRQPSSRPSFSAAAERRKRASSGRQTAPHRHNPPQI